MPSRIVAERFCDIILPSHLTIILIRTWKEPLEPLTVCFICLLLLELFNLPYSDLQLPYSSSCMQYSFPLMQYAVLVLKLSQPLHENFFIMGKNQRML